jgi:hypothetical protein
MYAKGLSKNNERGSTVGDKESIFIGRVWEESDLWLETSYQGINQKKTTGNIPDRTRGEKHV